MRIKKILLAVVAILATSWLFNSCTKNAGFEETLVEPGQENQDIQAVAQLRSDGGEGSNEQKVILGEKRNNPFALANINQAKASLYGTSIPDKVATHKYVKFLPGTEEHLAVLEDWETGKQIPLFDFPLEYEVISGGETYLDPSVSDSLFTYQYAAVPAEVELPDVPNEIIDDLHLDKSDPLLLAESFWITDNKEDINEYVFHGGLTIEEITVYGEDSPVVFRIPEIPEEDCPPGYEWVLIIDDSQPGPGPLYTWECQPIPPPPPPPTNDCGCPIPSNRRNPAGCVRVDNDGVMDPVQIASIKVIDNYFTSHLTFTDENGCWRVNESYSGKMKMWVQFKNNNVKARDTRYWLGIKSVIDFAGRFGGGTYNNITVDYGSGAADNTSRPRRYWAAAHTLNTVNEYRNAAAADGVPLPRTGLNWINAAGDGGAAAPMLQLQPFNSWLAFLAIWQFPVPYLFSLPYLPDIVNQYDNGETAANFTGVGFHELGHASHYGLVGEGYWFGYRNHIINNGGYGAFGNFNGNCCPGRVALGEAIGNYMGAIYGGTAAGGELFAFNLPIAINPDPENFIPRGLMWDLEDDTPLEIVTDPNNATITGPDNISGFTPEMIFNGLTPNVDNIRGFRDRLRTLHLGDTPNNAADFDTFVDIYDVFN